MGSSRQFQLQKNRLSEAETISVLYHDIFSFPLSANDLSRWVAGEKMKLRVGRPRVDLVDNYYCLLNKHELVTLRNEKQKSSRDKIKTLSKVKEIFESDKSVLMVGITGSLAMLSASEKSDIDLMLVTKQGKLWSSRLKTLLNFKRQGIPIRR